MSNKTQIEEIVNPEEIMLISNIQCPIDHAVPLENAVVCKKCETIYCKDCIEEWKKTQNNCPMRCGPIEFISVEKTILAQQIDKIKIKCKNENFGCNIRVLLKEEKAHECLFKQVECVKCNKLKSEGFMIQHLLNECDGMKLQCFVCQKKYSLNEIDGHYIKCLESHNFCEMCNDYHAKSNSSNKEGCKLKVSICNRCGLPELNYIIGTSEHQCMNEKTMYSQGNINNYLLQLTVRMENAMEKSMKDKNQIKVKFHNELSEKIKYVIKKIGNKHLLLEKKKQKIYDDCKRKINGKNQMKLEEVEKYVKKIQEIQEKVTSNHIFIYYFIYIFRCKNN